MIDTSRNSTLVVNEELLRTSQFEASTSQGFIVEKLMHQSYLSRLRILLHNVQVFTVNNAKKYLPKRARLLLVTRLPDNIKNASFEQDKKLVTNRFRCIQSEYSKQMEEIVRIILDTLSTYSNLIAPSSLLNPLKKVWRKMLPIWLARPNDIP